MTRVGLVAYVTGALFWAAIGTLVVYAILSLSRACTARRDLPVVGLLLFFLVLTQYPFPDRATLICPVPMTEPLLVPFHSINELRYANGARGWFFILSTAMNFALCAAIGLALAAQGRLGWLMVAAVTAATTLAVELTQLTGIWGLYPCAYRQFDVDDLILNFVGTLCGYALGRFLNLGDRRHRTAKDGLPGRPGLR